MPRDTQIRVNLRAAVNASDIRTETYNGREHIVVPSYTLPDGVIMNNGLYTKDEIDANYATLEGTFAPVGHPMVNGKYVSATTPEAVNGYHVGAFNRNVKRVGNRVYVEKWIDKEVAANSAKGRDLLAAIEAGDPIHTSTGVWLDREPAVNAEGYAWIARIKAIDHDAILINEVGAATPEQGVGMMVNVAEAVPVLAANLGAMSYSNRSRMLRDALADKFPPEGDGWLYVEDFDDAMVVYSVQGESRQVSYVMADGAVEIGDDVVEVESRQSWVTRNPTVNRLLQMLGFGLDSAGKVPVTPNTPTVDEADDMKPEEIQAMLDAQAEKFAANLDTALKPLSDRINAVDDRLTANERAAETEKRDAVAEKLGKTAAEGLTGNALDEAFAKLYPDRAAPALPGAAPATNADDKPKGAPKADDYFNS